MRTRRDSKGGFSFLELNDGSCLGNVQVIAEGALPNYQSEVLNSAVGCSVTVDRRGPGLAGQGAGRPRCRRRRSSSTAGPMPATYPLQKKGHSMEFLREQAHLRPRTQHLRRRRPRPQLRLQLDPRILPGTGFSLHPSADHHRQRLRRAPARCSASRRSTWASCRATRRARSTSARTSSAEPTYLTVSGQLEAEIFACALGKVYTFGPTFRAENSNTSRHLAEFWMIEPEMAFYELTDNMDLAEAFLKRICRDVLERCAEDMQFFQERIDKTVITTLEGIVNSQFVRLPYTEAVDILQKSGKTFEFPVAWGSDLQVGTRALPDRKAFQESGDPVRLSARHQSRSTCG